MYLPENFSEKTYMPAVLKKTSVGWLIEFYALHPTENRLIRKQIKLNRQAKRFARVGEFRSYAADIVNRINIKLAGGWNPFIESENIRLYTKISDVIADYLQEKKRELRPATMVSYTSFCRMLTEWLGNDYVKMYASMFNRVYAIRYLDYLYKERGVSARTWNNQLKMGRAFFNWAREKMYVKDNPFESIKTKKPDKKKRVLIEKDVRKRISDYLQENNPNFLAVCRLVFTSLIRPKEIRLIKVGDVRLAEKCIRIPPENAKNGNERFASVNMQLMEWLLDVHLERYPNEFYLFGSDLMPGKVPCGLFRFDKEWNKVRNALKLPKEMQLYSFRDTGINNLLKNGVDALTVMQHADHHDLSMTTRYANHADKKLVDTIFNNAPDF